MARRILAASAFALALALPVLADDGGAKTRTETGLEASLALAFADMDTSSTVDWGASSDGPGLRLEAWSETRFRVSGLSWLSMGPRFEAWADLDTDTVTPGSGNPYLVAESLFLRGLAGWGADASFALGSGKLKAGLTLLGGVGVLDLSDANEDYLTAGATAEYFWFRVEPCLAFDALVGYKAAAFKAKLHERAVFTWDSGNAYGRNWTPGFEEGLDAKASWALVDTKAFDLDLGCRADFSYESRIVVPVLMYSAALRADLAWKDIGSLAFSPLLWSFSEEVPDYDLSAAEDVERQLSTKLAWEAGSGASSWSISLLVPWWASEDGETQSGEWKLALAFKEDLK
jgi:hypothetical protein